MGEWVLHETFYSIHSLRVLHAFCVPINTMPTYPNLTTPGMQEARLDAIRDQMRSRIADIQSALTGVTPALSGITVTTGMFYIGDPDSIPDGTTNPFWVCVVGGGKQDGRDWESKQEFIGENIYHNDVYTNIYVYIHQDTFPGVDAFVQAEYRERLRSRICDWIRLDCFNNHDALSIPLASAEYGTSNDHLDKSWVSEFTMGYAPKGYGPTVYLYSAHAMHSAEIV